MKTTSTIKAKDLTKKLTLDIRITGVTTWRIRIWAGSWVIRIGALIVGCGVDITSGRDKRLEESNSLLRSAYQVAARRGVATNWDALANRIKAELDKQHKPPALKDEGGAPGFKRRSGS